MSIFTLPYFGDYVSATTGLNELTSKAKSNAGFIVAMQYDDNPTYFTRIVMGTSGGIWSNVNAAAREMANLGYASQKVQVLICPPVKDLFAADKIVRPQLHIWKRSFQRPNSNKSVRYKVTSMDLNQIWDIFNSAKFELDPVAGQYKALSPKKDQGIPQTVSTDRQFTSACLNSYPMPKIHLPEFTTKDRIRLRVRDWVQLNKGYYCSYESDDFRMAWDNLWETFDIRCHQFNFRHSLAADERDGYRGSVLQYAEAQGILEYVYAHACELYSVPDKMPALVAKELPVSEPTKLGRLYTSVEPASVNESVPTTTAKDEKVTDSSKTTNVQVAK